MTLVLGADGKFQFNSVTTPDQFSFVKIGSEISWDISISSKMCNFSCPSNNLII